MYWPGVEARHLAALDLEHARCITSCESLFIVHDARGVDPHRDLPGGLGRHVLDLDIGQAASRSRQHLARRALRVGRTPSPGRRRSRPFRRAACTLHSPQPPLRHSYGSAHALAQRRFEQRLALAHRDDAVVGAHQHVEPALRRRFGGSHGSEQEEQRRAAHQPPHLDRRPAVEQRINRQVEPVEVDRRRPRPRGRRAALAVRRLRRATARGARRVSVDRDRPRRRRVRAAARAACASTARASTRERQPDVHEREQREQPVVDGSCEDEIADQRAVEHRQPSSHSAVATDDELGEPVPGQHVAVDAARRRRATAATTPLTHENQRKLR